MGDSILELNMHRHNYMLWYLAMCTCTKLNSVYSLFQELGREKLWRRKWNHLPDIDTLDQSVNQSTEIGQSISNFTIGNESAPLPIYTKMVPIVEALADNLWDSSERTSTHKKRTHILRALQEYASN